MINYSLICSNDHQFEAWFRSYDDYNNQVNSKLIDCNFKHIDIGSFVSAKWVQQMSDSEKIVDDIENN